MRKRKKVKQQDQEAVAAAPAETSPETSPRRRFRFSKMMLVVLEATGVLAGLFFICMCLLLWRLASGPLDVGFARDYIEQALYDPVSGYSVRLERAVLEWPDLHGPLTLRLYRANLIGKDHRVLAVDEVVVGVSGPALLAGRVLPITIALDRPSLRLIRAEDGRVSFSVEGSREDEEDDTAVSLRIREALDQIDGSVNPRSPLSRLRGIEIDGASLILEDHVLGMSWYLPNLDITLARDSAGIVLTSALVLPAMEGKESQVQFNAVYSSSNGGVMHAHLTLLNVDPRIVSRKIPSLSWLTPQRLSLDGEMDIALDKDMNVASARLSLGAKEGMLSLDGVYETPVPFRDLALAASYDGARKFLDISQLQLTLADVRMSATGKAAIGETAVSMPLRLVIPELPQDRIAPLWPASLRGDSLEDWLVHRMSQGTVSDIGVGLTLAMNRSSPEAEWTTDVTDVEASFGISGMTVDYRSPLMPARDIEAKGKFSNDTLEIDIAAAKVGALDVTKGKVTIDHIASAGAGTADIKVSLKGPLQEVFSYIAAEPISMTGEQLGLNAASVKGQSELDVHVSFPTVKDLLAEQVKVTVDGTLHDVTLPDAVKTLPLTGGPFSLKVGDGQVVLKGTDGKIDGRPLTFEWQQYLESAGKPYSSRITADLTTDDEIRGKLGIDIQDWVTGSLPVKVVYTEMQDGRSTVDVKADAGPATLLVKPFLFEKPPGVAAAAEATVLMKDGLLQEVKDLTVKSKDIDVRKARLVFETEKGESVLRRGEIPSAILGESNAGLIFTIAQDGQLKIDVTGKSLDARPFLDGDMKEKREAQKSPEDKGTPLLIALDVDRMNTNKQETVEKVSLDLDLDRDGLVNRMEMNATAGNGPLFLRILPDEAGRMLLRFEAADAGTTLRAFGIYENVRGGTLVVTGQSADPARPRVISGTGQIDNFRVINAPVLARLISIISPAGLPQLLSNDGLNFSRLESQFDWHMRAPGDVYILRDGRTSGSSLGLTFAGIIDKEKNIIDLDGHVVPMSEVNNLISNIPLVGDILTGGEGALFAATYTLRGPLKKPDVSVNPLSVLAPGILRRILFEGGD